MYAGHEGGAYAKNSFGNVYVKTPFLFFLVFILIASSIQLLLFVCHVVILQLEFLFLEKYFFDYRYNL